MTIYAMENNTKVKCPDNHIGRLRVTRRVRKLVDLNNNQVVDVLGADGLQRRFKYSELVEVFNECTQDLNTCNHSFCDFPSCLGEME